jgi:hypothetical protein
VESGTETERIYLWRKAELVRAGYDHAAADLIAGREDIGLHEAIDLLEHSCPQDVALLILL